MKINEKIRGLIEIIVIVALFVLASYLVENNLEYLEKFLGNGFLGIIIFILMEITSIVIAPITTPLVPAIIAKIKILFSFNNKII